MMNKSIKQLSLIGVITVSSFSLMANPNTEQNDTQTVEQAVEQIIMIPVVNPITGEIELYSRCMTLPDCEGVVLADSALEDDNS